MRTVNDVIKYVNDIKPNAFTDDTLTEWLSECEGSIQTEILCIASGDVITYSYADNKDTELIVKPPHDKLYGFYLLAMIDFAHGEYKKYENTMQLFNAALSEFAKWFVRTHSKEAKSPEGYYMSGYDLAVKHGYSGSEEEWLKTLIGPQGEQGIRGEKGDRGIPGKIQSVTSGDNGKILVDGESVVVYDDSEIKEEIGGKVDKASDKGLSSNDYTDAEKNKLANLSNYDDTEIKNDINGKVDKEDGKGLSSNDFTDKEKTAISENTEAISAYHTYLNMVSDLAERNTTDIGKLKESKLDKSEAAGKRVTSDYGEIFNNPNNKAQALAHAENDDTQAIGTGSHAQGYGTITYTEYGDVIGKFNVIDLNSKYAHIVGNGRDDTLRSNAHTLDWDGNTWYKGKIKIGGTSYDDASAEEVATKKYVDSNTSSKEDTANKVTTLDENSTDTQYPSAKASYDELVKKADMQCSSGGFKGGFKAGATGGGGAIGFRAQTDNGGAVGNDATASSGFSGGYGAETLEGVAVGRNAKTRNEYYAIDAIQLGTGTNPNEKTLQIYDYQLMDADGHIPNDRMPTKADKTTITTVTEITSVPVLADNAELRFGELRALGLSIPITLYDGEEYKSDSFISSVIFKSGANVPRIVIRWEGDPTYPFDVYYQGADCKNGAFLPKANKRYTMIFSYDGIMNCYIAAVPIQTAETQSENVAEDEASVMSDESAAEETESVTEEPESEPNEVI